MSELQSVPEAATAKYVPIVTDPGSLRIDPAERLARQLLEPRTFAFLQGLREAGVCPSLDRDELLRVAAQVSELEAGDQREEMLCEHAKRETASGADGICIFEKHQLDASRVQQALARVMPQLTGANLARMGADRGSP